MAKSAEELYVLREGAAERISLLLVDNSQFEVRKAVRTQKQLWLNTSITLTSAEMGELCGFVDRFVAQAKKEQVSAGA